MYRKYYSYSDMPVPVKSEHRGTNTERTTPPASEHTPACVSDCNTPSKSGSGGIGGFLSNLETDDILLIAVILVLLIDDCDDKLLIGAIAFVLLSGWGEKK